MSNKWARDEGLKPMNGYVSPEASDQFKDLAKELQEWERGNKGAPEVFSADGRTLAPTRNREILEFVLWHGIEAVRNKIGRGSN